MLLNKLTLSQSGLAGLTTTPLNTLYPQKHVAAPKLPSRLQCISWPCPDHLLDLGCQAEPAKILHQVFPETSEMPLIPGGELVSPRGILKPL